MKQLWLNRGNTARMLCATLVLIAATDRGDARAQSVRHDVSRYFSRGADITSVPPAGQPGADYFTRGADVMSVPPAGQAGADYFSRGADVMSVPAVGQPGAEYFGRGADVTSVPAADVPTANEPTAEPEQLARTARVPTSAPTLVPTTAEVNAPEELDNIEAESESSTIDTPPATAPDEVDSLLPAWPPTFVESKPATDGRANVEAATPNRADTLHDDTATQAGSAPKPKGVDLQDNLRRFVSTIRAATLVLITLLLLMALAAFAAWRALKQRRD